MRKNNYSGNIFNQKNDNVSLIVSPTNVVMFNSQGAMYYAKDPKEFFCIFLSLENIWGKQYIMMPVDIYRFPKYEGS